MLADESIELRPKFNQLCWKRWLKKQVTIGDTSYKLANPFLVLATQNPLEQEGTYPLPEAQMDRFLFKIHVTYPTKADELEIVHRMGVNTRPEIQPVISQEDLIRVSQRVDEVYVDQKIKAYIVDS